jgi:hypothetical protein
MKKRSIEVKREGVWRKYAAVAKKTRKGTVG